MTLKVYFRTTSAAMGFRVAMAGSVQCSQPLRTSPRQGKAVMVVVTLPDHAYNRGAQARMIDRVIATAARFLGEVINSQDPQEIPS